MLPVTLVIFGATGDLSRKKLLPALFDLYLRGYLPKHFRVVGLSRRELDEAGFRSFVRDALIEDFQNPPASDVDAFLTRVHYLDGQFASEGTYKKLGTFLSDLDATLGSCPNRLFYLAVPPRFYADMFRLLAASGIARAEGENWSRILVEKPFGSDFETARALDSALHETKLLKESFVIKNMGGAGGNIAKSYIHQRKGDPYHVYVESNRIYVGRIVGTTPLTYTDVTPLGRLMTEYLVWAVRADSPLKTAKDVFAKLKGSPTAVTFGVGTVPSNDQMNILRPALAQGIDAKQVKLVSFRSGGDLMIQLLGGHVDVISTGLSEAIEQAKAGKVRLIAISSPAPLAGDFAKVPTWKSMGIDVAILHWRGLFAPPGIPAEAVKYWDATLSKMVKTPQWKAVLEKYQWFDAYADSAAFTRDLKQESEIYAKILTDLGMAKGLTQTKK